MSTVYGIVQQAGGYVTFDSTPGLGTTFRIFIPRVASAISGTASRDPGATRLNGDETVLLVEDDESVCELVKSVLTSQGYSVLAARHPLDAEAICKSHSRPYSAASHRRGYAGDDGARSRESIDQAEPATPGTVHVRLY